MSEKEPSSESDSGDSSTITAFDCFCNAKLKILEEKYENYKNRKIEKELRIRWKKASLNQKYKYVLQAEEINSIKRQKIEFETSSEDMLNSSCSTVSTQASCALLQTENFKKNSHTNISISTESLSPFVSSEDEDSLKKADDEKSVSTEHFESSGSSEKDYESSSSSGEEKNKNSGSTEEVDHSRKNLS